jgi:hypothetical protein
MKARSDWAEANTIIQSNYTGAVSILDTVASAYSSQKKGTQSLELVQWLGNAVGRAIIIMEVPRQIYRISFGIEESPIS